MYIYMYFHQHVYSRDGDVVHKNGAKVLEYSIRAIEVNPREIDIGDDYSRTFKCRRITLCVYK